MTGEPTRDQPADQGKSGRPDTGIDEADALTKAEEEIVERLSLRAPAIYAIVKEEGEAELARPTVSLVWSGLVAGIAMGFSVLTLALLQMHLPEAEWAPLVTSFGYATGFLIVILGRQQLFTQNTITNVLPLISERSRSAFGQLPRVWGIVLPANWLGCVIVALAFVALSLVPAEVSAAIIDVSRHYGELTAGAAFEQAIGAGFLIAVMVWMMPTSEGSEFILITATVWLIALAGFTCVVAGMVEIAALVLIGKMTAMHGLVTLAVPTLAGNVLGATGLFALLAYAQVKEEVEAVEPPQGDPPTGIGL